MSSKSYQSIYKENKGPGSAVTNKSLSFRIKRGMLDGFDNITKDIKKSIKRHGSKNFNDKLLDKLVPKAYKEAAKQPIDENKVVFVEVRMSRVTNSFEVMFDELANHYDYVIHTHFLLCNNVTRAEYTKRCLNAVEDIATAKYVFLNEASNVIAALPLREGTKIIQLWHGCGAFKKFGFSTADLIFGLNLKQQLRHPYYGNFSLVTVSSPEVEWAYNEAMNIPKESGIVQATGSSRTDIFFDEDFISTAYEHVYELIPQAKGKKIILYAPTFRGRVAKAKAPNRFNVGMFYEELGDDYIILFKHHPLVKKRPVIDAQYKDFAFDVTNTLSIEDLICTADFCISDYSSLIFEYSLFEKPLIFFAYDIDEYFDWRGFYYDYDEFTPGPIAKTNLEMIDYIKNIDTRFDKKAVQDFKYKFMRSCDGKATQRILNSAFEDLEKHRKPCEHFEHFYDIPKVEDCSLPYFKMIKKIKNEKEIAKAVYEEASKQPVDENMILAFDIKSRELRRILKSTRNSEIKYIKNGDSFEEVVKQIAAAKYILIDRDNALLNSLDLREETKVILLPENALPLIKFGKASKEYRSGLRKEQYALAPAFSSVNEVVCAGEETAQLFGQAVGNEAEIKILGDVKSDIFFDEKYQKKILAKLYESCPQLEGRKIISLIGNTPKSFDETMIFEYLSKDYVLLKHYDRAAKKLYKPGNLEKEYAKDTIVDVSLLLSTYELLAVSEIVVGGFVPEVYSAMAGGKPVIIYSTDVNSELMNTEAFIDIKENSPTEICSDINEVIAIIRNIENYDFTKYNAIKEKYLTNCDGSSAKRFFESL